VTHSLHETIASYQQIFAQEAMALQREPSAKGIDDLRIAWLGRKGKVTALYQELKVVSDGKQKGLLGKSINDLRTAVESAIAELKITADKAALAKNLARPPLDISLPVSEQFPQGSLHPITLMRGVLLRALGRLGFTVFDGPEIESDFYNFTALNIAEDHPARDMHDTFFIKDRPNMVLRTHTSNIQIHAMLKEKPPLRLVAPGRVYRVDNDATHTPMFHQLELVVVDREISFAHLKGLIDALMKAVFGSTMQIRLRPSYFPFVEPGAEVDMQCTMCRGSGCRVCKETGWLEIGGCGMIHPNVFEAVQYDSETYTGMAFGFGIDRMAMLYYGINDLRQFFGGDYGFSRQFPIYPPTR
jgi:phenylalanyl-tRNA synthetase alpha chain